MVSGILEPVATATRYRVIIADPPWSYSNSGSQGAAAGEYPTMTIADLCALPVAEIADDDAVLLLWGTWPNTHEAIDLVVAWGFRVVTGFPWVKLCGDPQRSLLTEGYEYKPQYGIGFWGRGCTEPVYICRRGKPERTTAAANTLLLLSENFGHSRKPENLYEYAEQFGGPYLEIFARRPRDGWRSVGNEISGLDVRAELAAMLPAAVSAAEQGRCFTCQGERHRARRRDARTRVLRLPG